MTGRSCFEVELEVGKRAKREREEQLDGEKGKGMEGERLRRGERFVRKGVVVRVETLCKSQWKEEIWWAFWERRTLMLLVGTGRYEGPHYVVFAKEPVERGEDGDASRRLEIVHHTLPPWVPLRELATKYLGVKVRGDDALGEEGGVADLVSPDHAPDFDVCIWTFSPTSPAQCR